MARSFVVEPYGAILAEVGREPGVAAATVDLNLRERRPDGFLWSAFKNCRVLYLLQEEAGLNLT